jgi:ribosomal protein L29
MAFDFRVEVNKAIADLKRKISEKNSELASLRTELATYQKVQDVLDVRLRPARAKANRKVRRKPVDWNSVLKRLPGSFAVGNVANLAKIKSRTYTHSILAKWIKQRKVKRLELGRYQKL